MSNKIFLLLHAVVGMGLVALTVHLFLSLLAGVKGRPQIHTVRRHSRLVFAFVVVSIVTGILLYPAFRIDVRGAWMDSEAPHLTGLFEIKEHWGSMALALAFGLWWHLRGKVTENLRWKVAAIFTAILFVAALHCAIAGLWLVSSRSV